MPARLFHKSFYVSFTRICWTAPATADTKREAQDWLKSECNNSTDEAIESAGTRKIRPRSNRKGEHCKMSYKFDGEDEKKGDMIQCCFCNIWFHV